MRALEQPPGGAMLDWRTLGLAAVAFSATFAGGWWIGLGSHFGVSEAYAVLEPSALLAWASSPSKLTAPAAQFQGKGLTDDDRLRQAVVLRAKAYQNPSCNQDAKTLYVNAASKYAEVLMRSTGCSNYPKCRVSDGMLDDVWRLNRSSLDQPVADAMAAVHAAGGLVEKDFRGDVGRAVRVIAGTDFKGGDGPSCSDGTSRSSWVRRIRIRR